MEAENRKKDDGSKGRLTGANGHNTQTGHGSHLPDSRPRRTARTTALKTPAAGQAEHRRHDQGRQNG